MQKIYLPLLVIVYLHQTSRHKIKLEHFTSNRESYKYTQHIIVEQYEYIFSLQKQLKSMRLLL